MEVYKSLSDMLNNSRYATYATVNKDCSPHNSPMFFIPSDDLKHIYMGTHPESLHAKNISRTGMAFAVLYGRTPSGGAGLYFKIENFHEINDEAELKISLVTHNGVRKKIGKDKLKIEYYKAPNPQRMYAGDIVEISTNSQERDDKGRIAKDTRFSIDPSELIG